MGKVYKWVPGVLYRVIEIEIERRSRRRRRGSGRESRKGRGKGRRKGRMGEGGEEECSFLVLIV